MVETDDVSVAKRPSIGDLNLTSAFRSTADLKSQADILAKIADVKMDEYMEKAPKQVKDLQSKGVPKMAFFGTGGAVFLGMIAFVVVTYGFLLLSVFVSVAQPLYYTFYALESTEKDDDTVWLTYWMVHGVLHVLEHTLFLPFVNVLPGVYYFSKIMMQLWMVNFQGATMIYDKMLAPYLRKHESNLQTAIDTVKKEAMAAAGLKVPPPAEAELEEMQEQKEAKQAANEDVPSSEGRVREI